MSEALRHGAPFETIFVHGAGETGLLWRGTLESLHGGKSAVALNLPGHPTGAATCKTVAQYASAVHEFITAKGIEEPAVCGHSMGGAIALDLAVEYPDDVGALILVGTGAKLGVLPEIKDGLRDHPMKVIEKTITPLSFFEMDLALGREARASLALSNPDIFLNDYLACSDFDVRSRLKEIRARTLIICGESDRMTPPKWSHFMNANISNSTLFFVRGAGHMVPLEKPQICGQLIQDFLSAFSL